MSMLCSPALPRAAGDAGSTTGPGPSPQPAGQNQLRMLNEQSGPHAPPTLTGLPETLTGREECLRAYAELMHVYEQKCTAMLQAVEVVCQELVVDSKIPEISPQALGFFGDAADEDLAAASDSRADAGPSAALDGVDADDGAVLSRDVKRCFVEAMERLQSTSVPKKRRGNLPKEATAAFKKWFDEHSANPYPTDEEKRILAVDTGTAISQITNWFINHRKRVWKPNLARGGEDGTVGTER